MSTVQERREFDVYEDWKPDVTEKIIRCYLTTVLQIYHCSDRRPPSHRRHCAAAVGLRSGHPSAVDLRLTSEAEEILGEKWRQSSAKQFIAERTLEGRNYSTLSLAPLIKSTLRVTNDFQPDSTYA